MVRAVATVVAFLASVSFTKAAAEPVVPLAVQSVLSGGYWREGDSTGTYRLVIERQGWEHLWSRLYVEWVAEPRDRDDDAKVVAMIQPPLPFGEGTTLLEARIRPHGIGRLEIEVDCISNGVAPTNKKRCLLLEAMTPGKMRPVKKELSQ